MVLILVVLAAVLGWALVAYLLLPALWKHYERQPSLATLETLTRTPQGIPGDPINLMFIGSEEGIVRAFHAAGWNPADPITLRSSARIAESVLLDRPDPAAPVSTLDWKGRKQDLAFEKPVGHSADQRHHVRLWRDTAHEPTPPHEASTHESTPPREASARESTPSREASARESMWLAAATFDRGVGVSHRTGQITHHIAPDLDAERDGIVADLTRAGVVQAVDHVTGIGPTMNGRNGGGDRYCTDGEIAVVTLTPNVEPTQRDRILEAIRS